MAVLHRHLQRQLHVLSRPVLHHALHHIRTAPLHGKFESILPERKGHRLSQPKENGAQSEKNGALLLSWLIAAS